MYILKYIVYFIILLVGKMLSVLLSPIIALCVDREGEALPLFKWAVTHDAPLNSWWKDNYQLDHWLKKKFSQQDYNNKSWIRWYSRMKWIVRNPAYGLAHTLGYDQRGMEITAHRDEGELWDTGYPNRSYYTAVNTRGQKAFMFEWQIYYYKEMCLEIYLGWKLFRRDPDERCMLVIRISPFRKYSKE